MNAQRVLVMSFLVCCGIIAWSDIGEYNQFPRPSRLVSAALTYVILGIVASMGAANVAGDIGIGLNVAQLYRMKWANGDGGTAGLSTAPAKNPFGL